MNKFLSLYKRNLETLSQLNQLSASCVQSMSRCSTEAAQHNMDCIARAFETFSTQAPANQKLKNSSEVLKQAWETSTASAKELAQILTQSNRDAFDMISNRMQESVSELQDIIPTTGRRSGTK